MSQSNSARVARILSECKAVILVVEPRAKVFSFGSLARGEKRRDWDINLLVLMPESSTNTRKFDALYAVHSVESANGALGACIIETEAFWNAQLRNCSHSRAIDQEKVAV